MEVPNGKCYAPAPEARAAAAAKTAYRASRAQQDSDFKTYVADLRVACDSCHGLYLKSDQ